MLSKALATPSRPSKNWSVKIFSVSTPTLSSRASTLIPGFMARAAAAAVVDLGFWEFQLAHFELGLCMILKIQTGSFTNFSGTFMSKSVG